MGIIFKKISVYIKNHKTTTAILLVCIAITVVQVAIITSKTLSEKLICSVFGYLEFKLEENVCTGLLLLMIFI